jgi:hypothetical protein
VNNMSNREEFNRRYEGVMNYYGVKPRHTNPASPHENGDAEQSHHRFKRAVEQALLLRGSRDFGSLAEYAQFLKGLFAQRNAGRRARLSEEMAVMRELDCPSPPSLAPVWPTCGDGAEDILRISASRQNNGRTGLQHNQPVSMATHLARLSCIQV